MTPEECKNCYFLLEIYNEEFDDTFRYCQYYKGQISAIEKCENKKV